MRTSPIGLLLALALAATLAGCGGDGAVDAGASASADGAFDAGEVQIAPDFELSDLDGQTVKLSALDGDVRLIDFWATWCPPCRDEIPMLNELHQAYADQGLTILAISDEKPEVVREFARDTGMQYRNLLDPGEVSEAYRVFGLPTAYLLDREGKVIETFFGPKSRKALEKQIRELLDLPPAT